MERFDHIIIGTGVAGTSAAEAIRARDPQATILLIGDESHRLYSRVVLPHVIRGKTSEEKAFLRAPGWYEEQRIDFRPDTTAIGVHAAAREVRFADGGSASYDTALLIATGGSVRQLDCPGAAEADIRYFQTLEDMRRIATDAARSVCVYGGGFIALELLMSYAHLGARTTAVMRGNGFFGRLLDPRGASMIHDAVRQQGIEVRIGTGIAAIERDLGMKRVRLTQGDAVACDAVAAGIGITPNVSFLEGSGIAMSSGILTDACLQTSVPGVFAAGDVAESPDPYSGTPRIAGTWQNAMFQGRMVGGNMTGNQEEFTMLTAYSITAFGIPIAFVGAPAGHADERLVRETMHGSLQVLLKDGRAVGATSVGPFPDRAGVGKLITGRVQFTDSMRSAVRDGRTDITSLVP